MNALGALIRDGRMRMRLTQLELARQACVSDRTIRDIELGKPVKSAHRHVQTFMSLARALELPVDLVLSLAGIETSEPANHSSGSAVPTIASFLGDLALLQGMAADVETARRMGARQHAALQALLWKADDERLRQLWSYPMRTIACVGASCESDRLPDYVRRVLAHVCRFREDMSASVGVCVEMAIVWMLERLRAEWVRVPYDAGVDDALFAEYVLGLAYFETTAHLARTINLSYPLDDYVSVDAALDVSSYAAGLEGAFALHECVVTRINSIYDNPDHENGWLEFLGAITRSERRCPEIRDSLKRAVSLRCVSKSLPETATAAQLHHWDGWGGDGKVLHSLGDGLTQSRNELLVVLHRARSNAFDWHCLRDGDRCPVTHFASRQPHFRQAAASLARYAAGCTAALLTHPALGGSADAIFLWGDAVGPTAVAERRIIDKVQRVRALRGEGRVQVWGVLTDASASSVAALCEIDLRPHPMPKILWRDLNKDFPGEPGIAVPERLRDELEPGRYDCYSCSIALHQVADLRTGRKRVRQVFAFATRVLRPGGVISVPDVGPGVYMQAYLLPTNLIDREGGWGCTTLFDEAGFMELACTLRGQPLDRGRDAGLGEVYKIPVPLLGLRRGTPRILDAGNIAIYEYVPYLVIDAALDRLAKFDDEWRRATSRSMREDLVMALISERWRDAQGVLELVERVAERLDCVLH